MRRVRAGQRRCHVTILQPVVTNGVQKWSTFGTDWVAIDAASGIERPDAQLGPPNQVMSTVLMLYRTGIRPKMRLTLPDHGSTRTLEIDSVINVDQANRVLQLQVREVTS